MIPAHCIICYSKLEYKADMYYCGREHEFWVNPYRDDPSKIRQLQIINYKINICWHYDDKCISFNEARTNIWFEPDLSDYPKLMNKIQKILIFL